MTFLMDSIVMDKYVYWFILRDMVGINFDKFYAELIRVLCWYLVESFQEPWTYKGYV